MRPTANGQTITTSHEMIISRSVEHHWIVKCEAWRCVISHYSFARGDTGLVCSVSNGDTLWTSQYSQLMYCTKNNTIHIATSGVSIARVAMAEQWTVNPTGDVMTCRLQLQCLLWFMNYEWMLRHVTRLHHSRSPSGIIQYSAIRPCLQLDQSPLGFGLWTFKVQVQY